MNALDKRKLLLVVMDGIGVRDDVFGNAVKAALTPNLTRLEEAGLYRTLKAHGKSVGMPSDSDMGNSEVGHNALGAGRIFSQGATLVDEALASGKIFNGSCWRNLIAQVKQAESTLHFLGLLSDGNVHSHEKHLYRLLEEAKKEGVKRVRIHALLDGRDVGEKSAEIYIGRLEQKLAELRAPDFDVRVASGGGRMHVTMDRYNADWEIVRRGWEAHVEGEAPLSFPSLAAAITFFRQDEGLIDQNIPAFVITENGTPVGPIQDHDSVIFFNFRGDRAIEISRAFTETDLDTFPRKRLPDVFYAGMMEYDGDLKIPVNYLVTPPLIKDTLGEYLVKHGVRQFACSETQKYGHVTYFWNGNRSGMIEPKLEEYLEIPSDLVDFAQRPWMKADEITRATVSRILADSFDFGRINFANGDMVGHTGNFEATVIAVATVDLMLGRLRRACEQTGTILIVTADHGNCDEMFESTKSPDQDWLHNPKKRPKPKTSHSLSPVPFIIYDPVAPTSYRLTTVDGSLGNVASSVISLLGLPPKNGFLPSLVERS